MKGDDAVTEDHYFSVKNCINGSSACKKTIKNAFLFPFFPYLLCPKASRFEYASSKSALYGLHRLTRDFACHFFPPPPFPTDIFFNGSD